MMAKTPLQDAVDYCGSQSELARRIGVSQQAISIWLKSGKPVDGDYVIDIETATDGHVPRERLRPDLYGNRRRRRRRKVVPDDDRAVA
jgi:DNA-binding transcriptional regulator YdaS (Cro superfamily)